MSEHEKALLLSKAVSGESSDRELLLIILELVIKQNTDLAEHMATEEPAIKSLLSAFPAKPDGNADVEGHQAYHIRMIEEYKEKAEIRKNLTRQLASNSLTGLIFVLLFLIGYWWKNGHTIP